MRFFLFYETAAFAVDMAKLHLMALELAVSKHPFVKESRFERIESKAGLSKVERVERPTKRQSETQRGQTT